MNTATSSLSGFSQTLAELISKTVTGVVAVKAAPHRVVSGVSIREDLIAIAAHALRREERVPVQASDGTQGVATLLGREPGVDVAVLRVEGLKVKPLDARDPSSLKVGMLAAVVGLTMDVGPSASLGILGAVGPSRRTWRGGTLDYFLRLDVNVYPSQTGAAVVDSEGALIGLATPVLLRHSSVAVSAVTLNRIADELLREGHIRHGYLGVGLQPVAIPAALREKVGTLQESGLIILNVVPDSSADKAGLQLGDILISVNAQGIGDVDDLQNVLRGDTVGQTVTVVLLRGGERVETQVTVTERQRQG